MYHKQTRNWLLSGIGAITLVGLSGCPNEKPEIIEPRFVCSGDVNSNVWDCSSATPKPRPSDLQEPSVVTSRPMPPKQKQQAKGSSARPANALAMNPPAEPSKASSSVKPSLTTTSGQTGTAVAGAPQSSTCQSAYRADQFYLQFAASRKADRLKALIPRLKPVRTEIIPTTVKGETWLVLISKGFNSRKEAEAMATSLEQRGVTKPWIRPGYSLLKVLANQTLIQSANGCQ